MLREPGVFGGQDERSYGTDGGGSQHHPEVFTGAGSSQSRAQSLVMMVVMMMMLMMMLFFSDMLRCRALSMIWALFLDTDAFFF